MLMLRSRLIRNSGPSVAGPNATYFIWHKTSPMVARRGAGSDGGHPVRCSSLTSSGPSALPVMKSILAVSRVL